MIRMAVLLILGVLGCHRAGPTRCEQVPTTADGCRELCHDRGAEMTFFRYDPDRYQCDAACECAD